MMVPFAPTVSQAVVSEPFIRRTLLSSLWPGWPLVWPSGGSATARPALNSCQAVLRVFVAVEGRLAPC